MKKGIILFAIFVGGVFILPSCAPKSQCKAYHKKQNKARKSRYQVNSEKNYLYENNAF